LADSALLLLLPQLLLSVALAHWLLRQHLLRRSADSALLLRLQRHLLLHSEASAHRLPQQHLLRRSADSADSVLLQLRWHPLLRSAASVAPQIQRLVVSAWEPKRQTLAGPHQDASLSEKPGALLGPSK
jgi:hypothetical protein